MLNDRSQYLHLENRGEAITCGGTGHGSCSHCGAPEVTWLPSWRVQMYPRVTVSRDVYALFKLPQLVEGVISQGTQCEMTFSSQPQEGSLETWKEAEQAGRLP